MLEQDVPEIAERQDLVITRAFDAPVELVWRAWTEPELVMRWWGPEGFTCPSAVMDVREGGRSILCMRAPAWFGGQDMYSTWEYRKIVPMERIEFIHNLSDKEGNPIEPSTLGMPADFPKDQLQIVEFKSLDNGGTELTITEYGWMPGQMMKMSEMGMNQCLNKMAAMLEGEN